MLKLAATNQEIRVVSDQIGSPTYVVDLPDVAVDIRKGSPNYKKWVAVELSADNFKQLFIPAGFAHGFLTLTDDCEIQYKASDYYTPDCDRSIKWDDPTIGVEWNVIDPVVSSKDQNAPLLTDSNCNFIY